jgi:RHS repeat-associated protein
LDFPLAQREGIYTRFLHLDGQGNVDLLTAPSTGNRVTEYRYRAWGDRYVTPVGENWTSTLTYKGREEDRETGLVYMRHRYYSPRLERFLNADPIGVAGGLNVYAFAGLDPANLADRMGLCPTCDTIHVVDKAPPSPAEEELFGMWFYDYMNSLINGYDAWSNPFAFASSVPSKKKGGARFGPSTPRNNQGPKPPKVEPNWGQCMANAGASAATVALGLAVHSSGAAYRALAAERTEASWVFASWGVSVGAYMLEFEAAVLASTGATLAVLGGTLIAGGVAGLVVGTAIACM